MYGWVDVSVPPDVCVDMCGCEGVGVWVWV